MAWFARAGMLAMMVIASATFFGAPPRAASASDLPPLAQPVAPASAFDPALKKLRNGRLLFQMSLTEPLEHHVFDLGPSEKAASRLIVDFPEVAWRLPLSNGPQLRAPGVRDVRFGLFREGRSRMVFDLDGPVRVLDHQVLRDDAGRAVFQIQFHVGAPQLGNGELTTGAILGAGRQGAGRQGAAGAADILDFAPVWAPRPALRAKPLIVASDAGHGGRDPGAVHGGVREKDVTLQFARELANVLYSPGRIHVVLTRDRDEFIHLGNRVERALRADADLFISIHADASPNNPKASGASVYTLSDVASDKLAASLARRENAADGLAGVEMPSRDKEVRQILVDLAQRRSGGESDRFAELVVREMSKQVRVLNPRPHRFAGFVVLKTFDTPSVLVELGFLTNAGDRRLLLDRQWRQRAQLALSSAVRRWAEGESTDFVNVSAPR
ncbi:MAG: N-acetylmuramoyl-L-alanine amidase [Neomegalonema sp.]